MSWETRGVYGPYYTRSRRVDGRVVREYVGRGPLAESIAQADEAGREARRLERGREREELERDRRLDETFSTYSAGVDELLRGVLEAAGYHRHKRGEWRRLRVQKETAGSCSAGHDNGGGPARDHEAGPGGRQGGSAGASQDASGR